MSCRALFNPQPMRAFFEKWDHSFGNRCKNLRPNLIKPGALPVPGVTVN